MCALVSDVLRAENERGESPYAAVKVAACSKACSESCSEEDEDWTCLDVEIERNEFFSAEIERIELFFAESERNEFFSTEIERIEFFLAEIKRIGFFSSEIEIEIAIISFENV